MKCAIERISLLAAFAILLGTAAPAGAWPNWWLPTNYSVHGRDIDLLFDWIFWISIVVMVGVNAAIIGFMIRYRHRQGRKAHYTHGNTRLEIVWTIIPAVILGVIAVASKQVWSDYRYADTYRPPAVKAVQIMVIGEQFKWNIVYPGPDGKFGRYLIYPRPSDAKWPDGTLFNGYAGPRDVPADQVSKAIQAYVISSDANRLGKDFDDPNGKDDICDGSLGRTLEVPLGRPVDITITSKDVIHSFSLPDFRVKLDTVPGLRGMVSFTTIDENALASRRAQNTRQTISVDDLSKLQESIATREWYIDIDQNTPGADKDATGWRYSIVNPRRKTLRTTIIRDGAPLYYSPGNPMDTITRLRSMGITRVTVHGPDYFDIVCQELCGQGHFTMQGQLRVIPAAEYAAKYETPKQEAK